jgi:ureidoacrylate peracid hydrolase
MAPAQEQSEAKLDRQSSALLIVDMQNDFCHPEGAQGKRGRDLSMIYGMIPTFAEVLKGARQIGLPVIFVRTLTTHGLTLKLGANAWTDISVA